MSIEHTHLILMCKGPEAPEFNMDEDENGKIRRNFGNFFTTLEYYTLNCNYFIKDSLFNYYVLYFGISALGLFSHEMFYSFHLLDVTVRSPSLQNVVRSVTENAP